MIAVRDLTDAIHDDRMLYGGSSCVKYGVMIDGERWMLKFSKSARDLSGKENTSVPPCAASTVHEYIGSHIYASLGIPAQETMLGYRGGKVVVACKDFAPNGELVDFGKIKNGMADFEDRLLGGCGGFHGEFLADVLTAIDCAPLLRRAVGVKEHFWDMFVVDGFIGNSNRSNGNWGVLVRGDGAVEIAPVYGNGNSFFSEQGTAAAGERMQDVPEAYTSYFRNADGSNIRPFAYMASLQNPDCTAALLRFAERLDMNKVRAIIRDIPETAFGCTVMPPEQKVRDIRMLEMTIGQGINPILERLGAAPVLCV